MSRFALLCSFCVVQCGCGPKTTSVADLKTQVVTMPDGRKVRCEVAITNIELMRGMMFRDSLAPDRGMLFVHAQPGTYTYYMYQVKIPLDIIWLNNDRRVVDIAANVPPCNTKASECPQYGGKAVARFVLELAGGMAQKYGLKVGDTVDFNL